MSLDLNEALVANGTAAASTSRAGETSQDNVASRVLALIAIKRVTGTEPKPALR